MLFLRRLIICLANLFFPFIIWYAVAYVNEEAYFFIPESIMLVGLILISSYHLYRIYRQVRLMFIRRRVIDLGFSFSMLFLHAAVAALFVFWGVIKLQIDEDATFKIYLILALIILISGIITGDQNIILNRNNIFFNFRKRIRVPKSEIKTIRLSLGFILIDTKSKTYKMELRNFESIVKKNLDRVIESLDPHPNQK